MRMIDADALFNWGKHKLSDAVKYGNKDEEHQDFSYSTLMMYEIADEVDDAPTIDAVTVVRCRDCKHYQTDVLFNSNYCCGRRRKPDDYCSYGERKEDRK